MSKLISAFVVLLHVINLCILLLKIVNLVTIAVTINFILIFHSLVNINKGMTSIFSLTPCIIHALRSLWYMHQEDMRIFWQHRISLFLRILRFAINLPLFFCLVSFPNNIRKHVQLSYKSNFNISPKQSCGFLEVLIPLHNLCA